MLPFSLSLSLNHRSCQTPNRLNVPHDRVLIRVVTGMPREPTLKWGLSVCGDHEMTLQYACGAPTFFHPFVHCDVPFLSRLPLFARSSLPPYISLFSLFLPFPPPSLSVCLFLSFSFLIGYALQ